MPENPFGSPAESGDDTFEVVLPDDTGDPFHIDPGEYTAMVDDVVSGYSKSGNPMWTWTWKIQENMTHGGKTLKNFTALTQGAMWKVTETMAALGLGGAGQSVKFKKSEVLGKRAKLVVGDTQYDGKTRSSILEVRPL